MNKITQALAIALTFSLLTISTAQDQRRAQRRALVEDLLKGLIESAVEKPRNDHRHNARPGQPVPGNPGRPSGRPINRPPVTIEVSNDMLAARRHLVSWNQSAGKLVTELRHHEYESPQLRPLLADALKLQANIQLLTKKAQIYPTIDPLVADFQLIDRDWRVLSHRLSQTRGLPSECSGFINSISNLDTQLCGVFNIQPQIDRRELQRLSTKLQSDYNHMLQDVYYLARGKQGGRELMLEGKQVQSMIGQASAMIGRGDYDTIVDAYRQCTTAWKKYSRKLLTMRDDRLRHSISDIEATGRMIHEQLWLPVELDREYLASMANGVSQNANQIFNSISMAQLMAGPQPGIALTTAREFQHACANFSNGISSGARIEDLEWDFRLYEAQWNHLHDMYHEFHIPEVDLRLDDIDVTMQTLKQTFGEPPVMDQYALSQLTTNLHALCKQTSKDVHRRITSRKYDNRFHDQICGAADQLSDSARQLHQRVLRKPNSIASRNELNDLFVQWRTLKPLINQCQEQDKLALNQYRSQIEPLMVKLQVVFAD